MKSRNEPTPAKELRAKGRSVTGFLLLTLGALAFSTKAIFVKLTYAYGVDAITSLTLRMLMALPFYVIAFLWAVKPGAFKTVVPRQWLAVGLMGIVGYYLSSILDFSGLQSISASLERLILFLYPTIVVLINAWLFKKKPTGRAWLAILLTYVGLLVVFAGDASLFAAHSWIGIVLVFLSAVTYAIYFIGTGKLVNIFGTIVYTSLVIMISTVMVFGHFMVAKDIKTLWGLDPMVYLYSALMAVLSTVIPTFLTAEGINRLGSGRASVVSSAGPIFTIVLAGIFLGEPFIVLQMIGAGIVILGVLMIGLAKQT